MSEQAPGNDGSPVGPSIEPWLREILRCPACHSELRDEPQALACTGCGRTYRVDDGIPVLLVDEATDPA